MAITELGGGPTPRGPEDPEVRDLPLLEEGEQGQLIKTLATMQYNMMKYGSTVAPGQSGNGMPGGMSPSLWSKIGHWFKALFGGGGGSPSGALTAEQQAVRQAVLQTSTINGALPATGGSTAAGLLGTIDKYAPLIKTGSAILDAYTQNKANNNDRALVGANMQANEVASAENAQQSRARLVLEQQQAERAAQSDAYAKALQGALGRYGQDVTINRPEGIPTISFANSPRPSSIGDTGRANAALLESLATRQLSNPEPRTVLPPLERVAIPGATVTTGSLVPPTAVPGAGDGRGHTTLSPLPLTPEEQLLLDLRGRRTIA